MPKIDEKDVTTRAVVGTFQVKLMLSQQREFTMTGHLYSDDTAAEINGRVDSYQDVADRQLIRADVFQKRARIEQITTGIALHRRQLEDLQAKVVAAKKGEKGAGGNRVKVSSQEEKMLETGAAQLRAGEQEIESLRSAIAAAEAKLKD